MNKNKLTDHYKDYKWIKVKKAIPVEINGKMYVEEQHHIEETAFLIEEVRKLAAALDIINQCNQIIEALEDTNIID